MQIQEEMYETVDWYREKIASSYNYPANLEDLFTMLRYIGLSLLSFGQIDQARLQDVKITLKKDDAPFSPSFLNFEELSQDLERFLNIEITPPPRVPLNHIAMDNWEERTGNIVGLGLDLIEKAIEAKAILQGKEVLSIQATPETIWTSIWNDFQERAKKFIDRLSEEQKKFNIAAEDVFELLVKYSFLPEDDKLYKLLTDVTATRKDHAQERFYRRVFSPDEVRERYEADPGTGQESFYLFKASLAQEALKQFILHRSLSLSSCKNIALKQLDKQIDIPVGPATPIIRSGNQLFGLYLLGFGLTGWGVRKDDAAMKALKSSTADFKGALFCSLKEYAGYWVYSFDSYKDESQFRELINPGEQGKSDFIRLDYALICDEDQRESFLEKAAKAVMEQVHAVERVFLDIIMRNASENVRAEFIHTISQAQVAMALVTVLSVARRTFHQRPQGAEDPAYYVPTANLRTKSFLDPNDYAEAPEAVRRLINQAYENRWYYIWSTVKLGQHIGKWQGPESVTGDGFTLEIPEDVDSVWFLIGQQETLERVKNNQAQEEDRLYMVIYGPQN